MVGTSPAPRRLRRDSSDRDAGLASTVAARTLPSIRAPDVICAMNQALLDGLLRGLGDQRIQAVLAPRPGACCVELHASGSAR